MTSGAREEKREHFSFLLPDEHVIAAPLNTGDGLAVERFERSEALEPFDRLRAGSLNDWNGSRPTVNSEFSSQKIWLFSDLSKYTGHFACGVFERFEPSKAVERLERASKSGAVDVFLKRDDISEGSKRKLLVDNTERFYGLEKLEK